MKRFELSLSLLLIFLPTLICQAETTNFQRTPNDRIPPELLASPPSKSVEFPYTFTKLTLNQGPAQEVKLHYPPSPQPQDSFSFVNTAEAFMQHDELMFRNFEVICNKVNEATSLDDLQRLLSDANLGLLRQAASGLPSEYAVVAMVQSVRPQNIQIVDAAVFTDRATLSVTGQSTFGPMNGLINLVRFDGIWKIDREEWYAGYNNHSEIYNPLSVTAGDKPVKAKSFVSRYSPDYNTSRKFLSLMRAPHNNERKAFTFVFMMNKDKTGPRKSALTKFREDNGLVSKPRPYLHVMWTGSKRLLKNQHMVKDQYPMDVSIAPADDGYATGQWNVLLPRKKPNQVRFALMWAF